MSEKYNSTEIERLRDILNNLLEEESVQLTDTEVLKISQELDKLLNSLNID